MTRTQYGTLVNHGVGVSIMAWTKQTCGQHDSATPATEIDVAKEHFRTWVHILSHVWRCDCGMDLLLSKQECLFHLIAQDSNKPLDAWALATCGDPSDPPTNEAKEPKPLSLEHFACSGRVMTSWKQVLRISSKSDQCKESREYLTCPLSKERWKPLTSFVPQFTKKVFLYFLSTFFLLSRWVGVH